MNTASFSLRNIKDTSKNQDINTLSPGHQHEPVLAETSSVYPSFTNQEWLTPANNIHPPKCFLIHHGSGRVGTKTQTLSFLIFYQSWSPNTLPWGTDGALTFANFQIKKS